VPIALSRWKLDEIGAAYRAMAEAGYRPAAPSDGFGNITVPLPETDIDQEIRAYAERFVEEEDSDRYWAGCTHDEFLRAAVWTLEAFRLMNGGRFWGDDPRGPALVPTLLRMAADEYERAQAE
jgi:hypothetical protein